MNYQDFLGDAYDYENNELNTNRAQQNARNAQTYTNVLLMGATGVGKSTLINAIFGADVAKAGVGKPVTQRLEKITVPEKGLVIWDTKGIEADAYDETFSQLEQDIEQGFNSANPNEYPDVALLCIKETSARVEGREEALLSLTKKHGIPTIVVFTCSLGSEDGDRFVEQAKQELDKKFGGFLKNRYVQVNSIPQKTRITEIPSYGLEDVIARITDCLGEAKQNATKKQNAFMRKQQIERKERLEAMISEARTVVHWAAAAAGTAGASPIPGSDAPIIAGIQSTMIYKINTEFEVNDKDSSATSLITGILGVTAVASLGRTVAANLLKFIPGAGSVVGATTAIAITEAIGHAYIKVLESYYDMETGQVKLPVDTALILNAFKSFYKAPN